MKIMRLVLPLWILGAPATPAPAADTWVYAVQLTAEVQTSPPRIRLNWVSDPYGAITYTVHRKSKDAADWQTGVVLAGSATNFVDNQVGVGGQYEYQVVKHASDGYRGYGYAFCGINAPLVDVRGKLILIVATNSTTTLGYELARLESDLVGDGWRVVRRDVSSNQTPASVRQLIQQDYFADPDQLKSVFLLGRVPVFYSGNLDYDGHLARPMPADAYYGDVDGDWSASPDFLPSDIELMVGRVDLSNMPGEGALVPWPNETELLRNYLNKNHNWRHRKLTVPRRALMGDRREVEDGEATAATGYRNFYPLLGPNLIEADVRDESAVPDRWSSLLSTSDYLLAYGCGGGLPSGVTFLGAHGPYNEVWSTDIVDGDARAVFVFLFGSWFGDWSIKDNFLRSFLATPTLGLASAMAGRPHWFFHHMGLGETIGYGARLSMNNRTLYQNHRNDLARAIYTALMGDPTLRLDPVSPPSQLTAIRQPDHVFLYWSAASETVVGYHVYRAASPAGPFTRLTNIPVPNPGFADSNAPYAPLTYMVRAIKLQTTPSGTYFNPSQGVLNSVGPTPVFQVHAGRETNGVVLSWFSKPGAVYRVLALSSVADTNWVDVSGMVVAPGPVTTWTDMSSALHPHRFYRVTTTGQAPPWMDAALEPRDRADLLLAELTLEEKILIVHGSPGFYVGNTTDIARLGIPALNLQDGPAGVADGALHVTALPAPMMLAASWDLDLARDYGSVAGKEARGKGVNVLLGPMINLVRIPQGGRSFETYGEDPYLSSQMAAAWVRGAQSHKLIATPKHFVGNEQETTRGNQNSVVDIRTLQEIYYPPFLATVRAGVGSLCSAYNAINGPWASESPTLNSVIKRDWGFKGFIMCDWGANFTLEGAVMNGLDLEMPTGRRFSEELKAAVQNGSIPVARLDGMVRRILEAMFRFDLIDDPSPGNINSVVFTTEHAQKALEIAEKGLVLVKNNGILPFSDPAIQSIAVSGIHAHEDPIWTGTGSARVFYLAYYDTPLNAISNRAGANVEVSYSNGTGTNLNQAVELAQQSDIAIVCVGEQTGENFDRDSLSLPSDQDQLISAVAAVNSNTVVVMYPSAGTLMPWINEVAAVVIAWFPGLEGGKALSSALWGDVNPSGKLPVTFPRAEHEVPANTPYQFPGTNLVVTYSEGLLMGYRWYDQTLTPPLFPFGHGLSYTSFGYSNLTVSLVSPEGRVAVSFDVHNTGNRAGEEIAQLYLGFPPEAGEPPLQLKGFSKAALAAGQSTRLELRLAWEDLAYYETNLPAWTVPQGTFQVFVGASSRDIRLTNSFSVLSPVPPSGMHNLALFQPVTTSSSIPANPARLAVDGDPATSWTTVDSGPQSITVDLETIREVNRVRLSWDTAFAPAYAIRLSNNNFNWTDVYLTTNGTGNSEEFLVSGFGRYLQLQTLEATPGPGSSLRELEVFAKLPDSPSNSFDTVWVDDVLPAGAQAGAEGGDSWTWITTNPDPFSGDRAIQSGFVTNFHQVYFSDTTQTLTIQTNESLIVYLYIDPDHVPQQVMLQWNDGTWEHRAYWGEDRILFGVKGTASRRPMGPLPPAGQWVRLSVPAALVDLEGSTLNGMALTLFGGRATWDYLGKTVAP